MSSTMPSKTTFDLQDYLTRIGLDDVDSAPLAPTEDTLSSIVSQHLRSIPFENIDVVLRKVITMDADDVFDKLVRRKRGGYCFEQNTLLSSALTAIGFKVQPLLCKVRWGKPPEQQTPFTHIALQVGVPESVITWLVDVGFAGTNSIEPVQLDCDGLYQNLSDGVFRTSKEGMYTVLSVQDRNDTELFRDLYKWLTYVVCDGPDLVQANHFSYSFPLARFTNQFFISILHGDEKRHISNDEFAVRHVNGEVLSTSKVKSVDQLVALLDEKFGIVVEKEEGLGRFL